MQSLVHPLGVIGRVADWFMKFIMYTTQGTLWETPQRTHFWNNDKYEREILRLIPKPMDLGFAGDPDACAPWWLGFIPRFHIPILGGWRKFVVLQAATDEDWFIGWFHESGMVGISNVPLCGAVRMTIGSKNVRFFALTRSGEQVSLIKIGEGKIGEAGEFRHVPLL